MIAEGTRTKTGYVWTGGQWVKENRSSGIPFRPPMRQFGDAPGEGLAQDIAPLMRGRVEIDVFEVAPDGTKKLVERHGDHNMIVAKGPYIMANCLGGITHPNFIIGGVQWGTGGHVVGDPNTPVPPDPTDLTLETFVLETVISGSSVGDTYIQFESQMSAGQGNGNVFTEAGLVITGVTKLMFARKTFPGITKTANRVLTVRWIISFIQNTLGSDCQGVGLFGQLSPIRQYRYTIPVSPTSYTDITVPLTWTPGLNRLWVWRNGKRVFNGEAYVENHPIGIISINPPVVPGEVWTFEVIE